MKFEPSFLTILVVSLMGGVVAQDSWPQAAGPHGNWQVEGSPPTKWSATRGENIRWRTSMPEAGMSAATVGKDHVFVTTHVPIINVEDKNGVTDIIGFCLDADSGEILWQVELPGTVFISLAGGFTDGTVFAPITDGEHVWFFNRCGSMGCYDLSGNQVWLREWTPRFKHNNRQAEPFLVGDSLVYVEVANKKAGAKMQKWEAPGKKDKTGLDIPVGIDPREVWTYVHGISKKTGEVLWREHVGTVVHNTPVIGQTSDGALAISHARGGPHGPLEKPSGHSLTSLEPGSEGRTLWSTDLSSYDPSFASHWNEKYVLGFQGMNQVVMDAKTGEVLREQPVDRDVTLWKYDPELSTWIMEEEAKVDAGKRHPNTNQANLLVGDWHWFLAHDYPYVGRVHTETGIVEYLEIPAQLMADSVSSEKDVLLWREAFKDNQPRNTNGFAVGDKGHQSGGWGHLSAASPIRVGRYLFISMVTGTVHVIDTEIEALSPEALVATNDLGPGGKTWCLASLSFAEGRLYAHTMREILCIECPSTEARASAKSLFANKR